MIVLSTKLHTVQDRAPKNVTVKGVIWQVTERSRGYDLGYQCVARGWQGWGCAAHRSNRLAEVLFNDYGCVWEPGMCGASNQWLKYRTD